MTQPPTESRLLWGIVFSSDTASPRLLYKAWLGAIPMPRYDGEPSEPLLFRTRDQARAWARWRVSVWKGMGGIQGKWKLRVVRVGETLTIESL